MHIPPAHPDSAFGYVGHTLPQLPQLKMSPSVFTQRMPHTVGASGGQLHAPCWHVLPAVHTTPHAPQFWLSVCVLVHMSLQVVSQLSAMPSQSSSTPLHGISVVPFGTQLHTVPRPGTPAQLQLELCGQSEPPVHVREQRPIERHTPEVQSVSRMQGEPRAAGGGPQGSTVESASSADVSEAASACATSIGAASDAHAPLSQGVLEWPQARREPMATRAATRTTRMAHRGMMAAAPQVPVDAKRLLGATALCGISCVTLATDPASCGAHGPLVRFGRPALFRRAEGVVVPAAPPSPHARSFWST
jgi:hypothetical protein